MSIATESIPTIDAAADRLIAAGWASVTVSMTLNDEGERSYTVRGIAGFGCSAVGVGETLTEAVADGLADANEE